MSRRARLALIVAAATPLALVLVVTAAWAIDSGSSDGQVLRNVEVAGEAVGGFDRDELRPVVAAIAERYGASTLRVETSDGNVDATAEEVGLVVDQEATIEAALDEGRSGSVLLRPFAWLGSLVSPREAPVEAGVDDFRLAAVVAERDPTGRQPPVEPSVAPVDGELAAVPGKDGRGLDPGAVGADILAVVAGGDVPIVVDAEAGPISPRFRLDDAEALLARAQSLTDAPLALEAGGTEAAAPPETLRTWLTSAPTETGLELGVDRAKVVADLAGLLPDAGKAAVDAGFRVSGGGVSVIPGTNGTACCADEAGDLVLPALENPATPLSLPLRDVAPDRTVEEAQALGIVNPVGAFTTNHAAGESRVTNIHRIADLVRGVVIEPGATFSVNGHVGPRTRGKGFALGGFINNGILEEAVGGGVSQFATTLFNAAFFGGLDFVEYQSHSLYISRYPYGREATLSFPKPDLIIRNSTPHGVLIWPTYTDSSITVTLYSTRYVTADQTGQSKGQSGNCTRVTTQRTRKYVDGRSDVDTVFAVYRPGEGVDC